MPFVKVRLGLKEIRSVKIVKNYKQQFKSVIFINCTGDRSFCFYKFRTPKKIVKNIILRSIIQRIIIDTPNIGDNTDLHSYEYTFLKLGQKLTNFKRIFVSSQSLNLPEESKETDLSYRKLSRSNTAPFPNTKSQNVNYFSEKSVFKKNQSTETIEKIGENDNNNNLTRPNYLELTAQYTKSLPNISSPSLNSEEKINVDSPFIKKSYTFDEVDKKLRNRTSRRMSVIKRKLTPKNQISVGNYIKRHQNSSQYQATPNTENSESPIEDRLSKIERFAFLPVTQLRKRIRKTTENSKQEETSSEFAVEDLNFEEKVNFFEEKICDSEKTKFVEEIVSPVEETDSLYSFSSSSSTNEPSIEFVSNRLEVSQKERTPTESLILYSIVLFGMYLCMVLYNLIYLSFIEHLIIGPEFD